MSQNSKTLPSPYVVGPPVEGGNFFGRDEAIRTFSARLSGPQLHPLQILGIRRSGKTSFLKRVLALHSNDCLISGSGDPVLLVYVDLLQGARGPTEFYRLVAERVAQTAPESAPSIPTGPFDDSFEFKKWLRIVCHNRRLVILLDEFEHLATSEAFDLDFFGFLRSLITDRLVWVTASFHDLATLATLPDRLGNVSPLYNIFHPSPIYLGPMKPEEAVETVCVPANTVGAKFHRDEIDEIRSIAGDLPYFLQAVAETWFLAKKAGVPPGERFDRVFEAHSRPDSQTWKQWGLYWRDLSLREQRLLRRLTDSRSPLDRTEDQYGLSRLDSYGLIKRDTNGDLRPAGRLFESWIRSESDRAQGRPQVFIGHGRGQQWRQVRDYLERGLELGTVCFESEPREGESIVPILEDMKARADFAVIVMTKDDELKNKNWRARQNVVHEVGFFQAALDFPRVVVLIEEEVEMFSNLDGLQVIRFHGSDLDGALFKLEAKMKHENLCS